MTAIKRVTRHQPWFLRGQLLDETDFHAEQEYHRDVWRRHHAAFHSWGVINGLTVTVDNGRVSVAAGVAIDSLGHEVRLDEPARTGSDRLLAGRDRSTSSSHTKRKAAIRGLRSMGKQVHRA